MNDNKSRTTSRIATTAVLLAICVGSQFLKSLSVYITGPVINLCIILAVMTSGLPWGIILSVITPVTAFIIAASPVMSAVPLIIPFIMLGNVVLALGVHFLFKPSVTRGKPLISIRSVITAVISCLLKGGLMGLTIGLWLLPAFIPEESPLMGKLPVFQTMFSVTQLITALIGFVYFFIIWKPVKKLLGRDFS